MRWTLAFTSRTWTGYKGSRRTRSETNISERSRRSNVANQPRRSTTSSNRRYRPFRWATMPACTSTCPMCRQSQCKRSRMCRSWACGTTSPPAYRSSTQRMSKWSAHWRRRPSIPLFLILKSRWPTSLPVRIRTVIYCIRSQSKPKSYHRCIRHPPPRWWHLTRRILLIVTQFRSNIIIIRQIYIRPSLLELYILVRERQMPMRTQTLLIVYLAERLHRRIQYRRQRLCPDQRKGITDETIRSWRNEEYIIVIS